MDLRALQCCWDALARRDPLGAILEPLRSSQVRDLDAFFASGAREIDGVLEEANRLGLPACRETALDFGCGVGRLTQAMAKHFERCVGVDISAVMVRRANELNRHADRCRFRVNETDSLDAFADESFDFVYSNLVLQHLEPGLARRYIGELARVVKTGGLLVFQVPSGRDTRSELPWSAFRADVQPLQSRLSLEPGEVRAIRVAVRNRGDVTWPASAERRPVQLGNHWRDGAGALLAQDDARAPLPDDVAPGEEVESELHVTAPLVAGDYVLELDLVQEGIAWFAERGSRPARVEIRVRLASAARAEPSEPRRHGRAPAGLVLWLLVFRGRVARSVARRLRPQVEMNAIPRDDVLDILAGAGVRALEVVENDAAGPGWISLRYSATRENLASAGELLYQQ